MTGDQPRRRPVSRIRKAPVITRHDGNIAEATTSLVIHGGPEPTLVEDLFAGGNGGALTIGAVIALYAASRGFTAVVRALDVAYDHDHLRGWLSTRLVGLGLTVVTVLVAAVVLLVIVGVVAMVVMQKKKPAGGAGGGGAAPAGEGGYTEGYDQGYGGDQYGALRSTTETQI